MLGFGIFFVPLSNNSMPRFSRRNRLPASFQSRNISIYPSIDPLSEKNKHLDDSVVQKVCDQFGVDRSRPLVTQVSRFDRLKDPVGLIRAYQLAKKYVDCQLVLAGGAATDDPEGAVVFEEVKEAAGTDPDIIILDLPPWCALEINPLQQASTLVIQKGKDSV